MKKYRLNFKTYLNDLAKKNPSPGGGSAVCLAFCLGLSLIEKAINYSSGKNKQLKSAKLKLKVLRREVYSLIDQDAYLFAKIMASSGPKRRGLIKKSEQMIVNLARSCEAAFLLAKPIESGIKKSIISDFSIGQELIKVALLGCVLNLEANAVMFGKKNKNIASLKKGLKKWQF